MSWVGDSKVWCLQMVERAGYTSLDILDGDCVRPGPRTQASNCDTSLKAVTKLPPSGSSTTSRQSGGGGGGGGYMSLGTFFHNEDDSPLLVTSIDGLSAAGSAVSLGGRVSGPASLERDLLSSSTFSLLTPAPRSCTDPPHLLVKSRNPSPAKEGGYTLSSPATPYNSIRKRIKSVSIKYLKNRQRKKSEKIESGQLEEAAVVGPNFDFLNIDTKLKEISEKCSQLKCEAEQSISRLEMAEVEARAGNKEDFSVSQTEAQIEYSRR